MKVCIFLNDLNSAGGIQRAAINLAHDLQSFANTVLLTTEPLPSTIPFANDSLSLASLQYRRRASTRMELVKELSMTGVRLRRFVANNDIDVVLAVWYDMATITAWSLPKNVIKIGCEHIAFEEARPKWRLIRKHTYPRLDAVVALTARDEKLYAQYNARALAIPNAVPPVASPPYHAREKILLTAGHLISRKGIDRLLWALKRPLKEHPDWKFIIVGGGEMGHVDWGYMDYISVLLHTLDLEKHVEFHPATRKIGDWYSRSSIYVMGSRQEGLPMVLLEAKSYGLPIVAFDCPTGPREIINDGVDGFLIGNDTDAFADAVTRLIRERNLATAMSDAARLDVETRYGSQNITNQWRALIESIRGTPVPSMIDDNIGQTA